MALMKYGIQFYCKFEKIKVYRESALQSVVEWMNTVATCPEIKTCVIERLRKNETNEFQECDSVTSRIVKKACEVQDKLGSLAFHQGLLTRHWAAAQKLYWKNNGILSKMRPVDWCAGLIRQIVQYNMNGWKKRNEILHENKLEVQNEKEKEKCKIQIEKEFEQGIIGLSSLDQELIQSVVIEDILKLPTNGQKA